MRFLREGEPMCPEWTQESWLRGGATTDADIRSRWPFEAVGRDEVLQPQFLV